MNGTTTTTTTSNMSNPFMVGTGNVYSIGDGVSGRPRRRREEDFSTAETILDLEKFEQLQEDAERLKMLGNKHMASQEYASAYDAYTSALQLSPVGPQSHVYLSNRAAALLSLGRRSEAAADARRAIGLSPGFAVAHGRLGQALYVSKDYAGAVESYRMATELNPSDEVARECLERSRRKLARHSAEGSVPKVTDPVDRQPPPQSQADGPPSDRGPPENAIVLAERKTDYTSQHHLHGVDLNPVLHGKEYGDNDHNIVDGNHDAYETQQLDVSTSQESTTQICYDVDDNTNVEETHDVNDDGSSDHYENDDEDDVEEEDLDPDPDEVEANRLYRRGARFASLGEYRYAAEEYTAALFLCPNHPWLSFQLYVARANAHNQAGRHVAAADDARRAVGLRPDLRHGYSLLGRTLYYLKDYEGTVLALEEALRLGAAEDEDGDVDRVDSDADAEVYDRAYLQKARMALSRGAGGYSSSADDARSVHSNYTKYTVGGTRIPKLPPPRKKASKAPPPPPMPSSWPTQTGRPTERAPFAVGPERTVSFPNENLGLVLNRGCDGFVRVLSSSLNDEVHAGDVVREAAGVDLRRPITNLMWGDTIRYLKLRPRPVQLVVAEERGTPPATVVEEMKAAAANDLRKILGQEIGPREVIPPTPVWTGEEPVAVAMASGGKDGEVKNEERLEEEVGEDKTESVEDHKGMENDEKGDMDDTTEKEGFKEYEDEKKPSQQENETEEGNLVNVDNDTTTLESLTEEGTDNNDIPRNNEEETKITEVDDQNKEIGEVPASKEQHAETTPITERDVSVGISKSSLLDEEEEEEINDNDVSPQIKPSPRGLKDAQVLGGEILFPADALARSSSLPPGLLPWEATASTRTLIHHGVVRRRTRGMFGAQYGKPTLLALFRDPSVVLWMRRPTDLAEVKKCGGVETPTEHGFWIVVRAVDPASCKLRLSLLTVPTSVYGARNKTPEELRHTCFELSSPGDAVDETLKLTLALSSEDYKDIEKRRNLAVETSCWETALTYALHSAHAVYSYSAKAEVDDDDDADHGWKHQVVLGTLHSHVVTGDHCRLEMALEGLLKEGGNKKEVDAVDDHGRTALWYACARRSHRFVRSLLHAGSKPGPSEVHAAALRLDDRTLSLLLSADPSLVNISLKGKTPLYLAIVHGRGVGGARADVQVQKCASALRAWNGLLWLNDMASDLPHPVAVVASQWRPVVTAMVYSFMVEDASTANSNQEQADDDSITLASRLRYPLHAALESLCETQVSSTASSDLVGTITTLLELGMEPNERCRTPKHPWYGLTPLQMVAKAPLSDPGRAAAEVLVRHGGRLASAAGGGPSVDLSSLPYLPLDEARTYWERLPSQIHVPLSVWIKGKTDGKYSSGGGSESKQSKGSKCTLCWRPFGALVNRRHPCKATGLIVCDDCSSKRVSVTTSTDGPHRVTDGQYLRLRASSSRAERERKERLANATATRTHAQSAIETTETKERKELFDVRGLGRSVMNMFMEEVEEEEEDRDHGMAGLHSSLNQTKDALVQRGEKLKDLGERTAELADQSKEFADLAKALNAKQQRGIFGIFD